MRKFLSFLAVLAVMNAGVPAAFAQSAGSPGAGATGGAPQGTAAGSGAYGATGSDADGGKVCVLLEGGAAQWLSAAEAEAAVRQGTARPAEANEQCPPESSGGQQ
jgi:hypothetical protein